MEDRLLILRGRRGCQRSFTRIYEKYKQDLVCLAMALLNDPSLAEDMVHEVFIRFARDLPGFKLTGSLKGYLMTCLANQARNCNRCKRPRRAEPVVPAENHGIAPAPLERIACNEQLQRLAHGLEQLPGDQREVISLHLYGQMTFRVIAQSLGIPVTTAKSRYQYGLKKLRQLLNDEVKS